MARLKLPRPLWIVLLCLRVAQFILLLVLIPITSNVTTVVDIPGAKYFGWVSFAIDGFTGLFIAVNFFFNAYFGDIRFILMYTRYHHPWFWVAVSVLTELLFAGLFAAMAILSTRPFVFGIVSLSYNACVSALDGNVIASVYTEGSADDFDVCQYREGIMILASMIAISFGFGAGVRLIFKLEPKQPAIATS
ncbi:hypothetical protein F5X98DRAFT_372420 [Xylaria grammica]|nr:hypothetical protein F5X98DRAFT_372420 [Xylaria grammica]